MLGCDDGFDYVVKGSQTGKVPVNEQVVGGLGQLIAAPIPAIRLVVVPTELIAIGGSGISHLRHGHAHGSLLLSNCSEKQWVAHMDLPENNQRIAALAVLYGWTHAGDPQLIYQLDKPNLVWSVDHGNFFPGGPNWSIADLQAAGTATVFADLAGHCGTQQIQEAILVLANVQPEQIAAVVAAPPTTWAVTMDERIELAIFLEKRRLELLDWKP